MTGVASGGTAGTAGSAPNGANEAAAALAALQQNILESEQDFDLVQRGRETSSLERHDSRTAARSGRKTVVYSPKA